MNTFRPTYRKLTADEQIRVDHIKALAQDLHNLYNAPFAPGPEAARHLALGRTKLEESVMWAVKGITG